jgi:ubiquinone/menaquinone biosynthesis C-methylase UbiE
MTRRWNHNIHYFPVLIQSVPPRCRRALDVGCGEGTLARKLGQSIPEVWAIDVNEEIIETARWDEPASAIEYLVGDFLTFPFTPESFDFVACVAALHHMDVEAALSRMTQLLRPGGTLAILGLARSDYPGELHRDLAATVWHRAHLLVKNHWESPAPTVWPPPHTYREIRSFAQRTLPGARFRRHLLWRYSIIWTKAVAEAA